MKVLTWNVNCFTANRVAQKLRLLELTEWDVALLQEVGETTFAALTDCTGFEGVHALALTGGAHSHRDHGAAILVRDGHIADPELFDLHDGLGYDEVGSPSARAVRATASIRESTSASPASMPTTPPGRIPNIATASELASNASTAP